MTKPHWFGYEGFEALYCRNHTGLCWAKFQHVNSPECPQKLGWIRNPVLRFLFGWIF